ncbi:MAG: hypothetical protein RSB91_04980 [Clostridia bacterium]
MRITTRQNGIISYAGLDADMLWAGARRAFAQTQERVPERYASFLPIFPMELVQNMSYVGVRENNRARVSASGFSIDPSEYFQKLYDEMPELFADDNYSRNFDYDGRFKGRGVMAVDCVWAAHFPQYAPFMSERLVLHLIGGGCQAVAVPESVFPRGGGLLRGAERELRITARCAHYAAYVHKRLTAGERYDAPRFEADYLLCNDLLPLCVQQEEISRAMQDLSMLHTVQGDAVGASAFTENAKRAESILQYVPYRYACDTFTQEAITRVTARLMQLCFEGDEFVSDFWMPYQDASEYIDRASMSIDAAALCQSFQIAPAYDVRTGGGRYPECVRVVMVRDRSLRPLVADTLNNPAYGSGKSLLGMVNQLVYLPESKELLRQRKLVADELPVRCENTRIDAEAYRAMLLGAERQERKGKLLDAMYRREAALSQMHADSRAYLHARELLDEKVTTLEVAVRRDAEQSGKGSCEESRDLSSEGGYDADLEYLRGSWRSQLPPQSGEARFLFAQDPQRELSIESGYAMRNSVHSFALAELCLAGEPEEEESAELAPQAMETDEGSAASTPAAASEAESASMPLPEAASAPAFTPTPEPIHAQNAEAMVEPLPESAPAPAFTPTPEPVHAQSAEAMVEPAPEPVHHPSTLSELASVDAGKPHLHSNQLADVVRPHHPPAQTVNKAGRMAQLARNHHKRKKR